MEKRSTRQIKIALTGPESTGKSALAEELAKHYSGDFVPEYARTFLDSTKGVYNEADLYKIAKGQIENERKLQDGPSVLFCDTDLTVIKFWALHKYGRVDQRIVSLADSVKYDFYLLCYPDLEWENDPQRENPDHGNYFFDLFKSELDNIQAPYSVIKGIGKGRSENAIKAIDSFFNW